MKNRAKLLTHIFLSFLIISPAYSLAESGEDDVKDVPEYPGQQHEDKNGKTVKRWSTKGPVDVSQASEPFEQKTEKQIPSGVLINVDPQRRAVVGNNLPHQVPRSK